MNDKRQTQHNQPLTVPILEIITDAEKDALMHFRIQLRRRGKPQNNRKGATHGNRPTTTKQA